MWKKKEEEDRKHFILQPFDALINEEALSGLAPPPGRVAHAQRLPPAVPAGVWDLLVPAVGALCGRQRRWLLLLLLAVLAPPVAVLSVHSTSEGDVHQALAAGGQLAVRAAAGRGGTGFRQEVEEAEEEGDGHLGVSGSVRHLQETRGRALK